MAVLKLIKCPVLHKYLLCFDEVCFQEHYLSTCWGLFNFTVSDAACIESRTFDTFHNILSYRGEYLSFISLNARIILMYMWYILSEDLFPVQPQFIREKFNTVFSHQ